MSFIPALVWREALAYTLERSSAGTTLAWGLLVLTVQPISAGSALTRGLYLMNDALLFLPFRSDWVWGAITAVPGLLHVWLIWRNDTGKWRELLALFEGIVWLGVLLCIACATLRTTGVIPYLGLVVDSWACFAQLSHRRVING